MKKTKFKKESKRGTIKFKLIIIPLLVVFVAIAGITAVSSFIMRESMLERMEEDGIFLSQSIIQRLTDNSDLLDVVYAMVDVKTKDAARAVIRNEENIDNDLLTMLCRELEVDEISWYDSGGQIICSNIAENIGWAAPSGHPVNDFMGGSQAELVEETRVDSITGDYMKFGLAKGTNGNFVQVGMNVNEFQAMEEKMGYQAVLEELIENEAIVDAVLLDRESRAIGCSDVDAIGTIFDDEGSLLAAKDGIRHASQYFYPVKQETVYAICIPLLVEGEHVGALSIGY